MMLLDYTITVHCIVIVAFKHMQQCDFRVLMKPSHSLDCGDASQDVC